MLNCLIIDDEPLAQQIIERYIARIPSLGLVGKCHNAPAAMETLQHTVVDLLFLDIHLPQIDGISLLRALERRPLVVFTTAHPEFAVESYELDAIDYLLKPITFDRFQQCVDRVLSLPGRIPVTKTHLFLKVDGKLIRVAFDDILFVESLKDYLRVVTIAETYVTHMTMKTLEAQLPAAAFARVHRSYLVSLNAVVSIDTDEIDLGTKKIPIGESYRKKVIAWKGLL